MITKPKLNRRFSLQCLLTFFLTMYNLSDNSEFMICYETDEIIEEFFEHLLQRYQEKIEKQMKGSEFVIDIVNLLHYKCHKIGK